MKQVFSVFAVFFIFFSICIAVSIGILALRQPQKLISFIESLQPAPSVTPITIKGVGIIGDSLSDEYRADDSRGLTYASTTLNWVEILQKTRNINFGEWGIYEEPRREGFAYNFSRTGASIRNAIETGQHIGLAEEVKNRNVNVVIISVGVNDFSPLTFEGYESIYNGSVSDAQVTSKMNYLVADMKTIIETLQEADRDVRILVVLIPDWGRNNLVQLAFPVPEKRQKVSSIITRVNEELIQLANVKNVATSDLSEFYDEIDTRSEKESLLVGGEKLNKYIPSDNPRHVYLDDGVHPGTIYNGLLANAIVKQINLSFGTSIQLLTDEEILDVAGL